MNALLANHVRIRLSADHDSRRVQAMITRARGEPFAPIAPYDHDIIIKLRWDRIISLTLFIGLAILPVFRIR